MVSLNYKSSLFIFDENENSKNYTEMLNEKFFILDALTYFQNDFAFQQDGAPSHTANYTMENLPSILTPDLGLLFWMLLAFLVVFFVLAKYGFPAIIGMVEERKNYIDESLRKAHEASERLGNIQLEGESILQEARRKQAQVLKEAADTRDAIIAKAQEKAREEGNRLIAEAKAEIENEKQAAISDIRAQVAELSVKVAEKILRKELASDAVQMETIDRLLDEVVVKEK